MPKQTDQGELGIQTGTDKTGPVECLGKTFPNDDARREYYLEELRKKLQDPDFRKIEGFPIGEDEDILALSDPPYYTACPNPWLADFVKHYGKPYAKNDKYHREPFAADVAEGKNDPIYNAHSYHTKVPPKAIMRYLLHYTEPGDVILDCFCGTGMTGVASVLTQIDEHCAELRAKEGTPGTRYTVLAELAPIATFISANVLRGISAPEFRQAIQSVCDSVEEEYGFLYETKHTGWRVHDRKKLKHKEYTHPTKLGTIEFILYSDVVSCPECAHSVSYYSVAVDEASDRLRKQMSCPSCAADLSERDWNPVKETYFDQLVGKMVTRTKIAPALINYTVGKSRFEKLPDTEDLNLAAKADSLVPTVELPVCELIEGRETRRNEPIGITHFHQFFTPRAQVAVGALLTAIRGVDDFRTRQALLFSLTAALPYASRMRRFRADRKGGGPLSGTLYVSSLSTPPNVFHTFRRNADDIMAALRSIGGSRKTTAISTQSATSLDNLADCCVDYVFVDPPFGFNFDYSELNFIWECLLGVRTQQKKEAIISASQEKDLQKYRSLMQESFSELYRVLKPGRWMTVEFSNTQASIWNAIQTSLQKAGFVVANVAGLDKKQLGFKALVGPTAVKQDLVISAYKPNGGLEERFKDECATEAGVWDFVRTHLNNVPVAKPRGGQLEPVAERDPRILYDRTVAYYVRHGIPIPLSSGEFQAGLADRFPERDGMYFLPDQAAEYDRKRIQVEGLGQLSIFVEDERSAADWLRQLLKNKPSKYQDIQPAFFQALTDSWKKWETRPELRALLDHYFLCYQGDSDVPSQIHSYLSTVFKELRKLKADDPALKGKAMDRWYVPDPKKSADVEKLREKRLLDEFWTYLPPGVDTDMMKRWKSGQTLDLPGMEPQLPKIPKGKRLKIVRTEAVRVGFTHCSQVNNYLPIVAVARYIPEDVVSNDDQLQMIVDLAEMRLGM